MANRALKASLWVLLLVGLIAAGLAGYYFFRVAPLIRAGKQAGVYSSVPSRPLVAEFGLETQNGMRQTIADLKGKVVVIDVWATWCGTCLYNIPKIVALHDKYLDRPVEVIGLDVDDEGWAKVRPFLQQHSEINYLIAVPYPASSFQLKSIVDLHPLGNVSAVPTVFVVDRQGRLAGKFIELGHEKEIDDLVAKLLDE
jgi:thiol-disulfide isomerase/thioredoxin